MITFEGVWLKQLGATKTSRANDSPHSPHSTRGHRILLGRPGQRDDFPVALTVPDAPAGLPQLKRAIPLGRLALRRSPAVLAVWRVRPVLKREPTGASRAAIEPPEPVLSGC